MNIQVSDTFQPSCLVKNDLVRFNHKITLLDAFNVIGDHICAFCVLVVILSLKNSGKLQGLAEIILKYLSSCLKIHSVTSFPNFSVIYIESFFLLTSTSP